MLPVMSDLGNYVGKIFEPCFSFPEIGNFIWLKLARPWLGKVQ